MAEKKMTRKEALEHAIKFITDECDAAGVWEDYDREAIEVLNKMLASINKQASRPKSKTSARLQNEPMTRDFIAQLQKLNEPVNAKWMTEHVKFCLSSQKAVAIAKIAEEWGAIERVSIKNRTYYIPVEGWVMPK